MDIHKQLTTHGIKPSLQRIAIMEYLSEHIIHPTVDEIYTALFPLMPTLSKTTIYNTLRLFSEQGAIQMITIDEKNARFDAIVSPHAHFLCKKCGKIYDMKMKKFVEEVEELMDTTCHKTTEMHYYYKGICKNCL
jgi:Fur family ferric uptake transcriptional regulator/Fur family peroxide stress response transcriptional regulator